jgi:hypothetical protein
MPLGICLSLFPLATLPFAYGFILKAICLQMAEVMTKGGGVFTSIPPAGLI